MNRYDTSLQVERGQVHSGQSPNYNDYRARYGYARDYDRRHISYWRAPQELRGFRGGAAFSYGPGVDYDRMWRRGPRPPYDRGYRNDHPQRRRR